MKKAKIYIPTKTAMQSGRGKIKNWILEHKFENLVNTSKENIEKLKNYKFFHLLD